MKLTIKSRTELNQTGWIGAALLILGPVATAFCLVMFIQAPMRSYGNNPAQAWAIASALASILPFVGYVMLTVGRETISTAVSGDDA